MQNILKLLITTAVVAILGACGGSNSVQSETKDTPKKYTKKTAVNLDQYAVGILKATINGKPHEWKADGRQTDWFGDLDQPSTFISVYSLRSYDNPYSGNLSMSINRAATGWMASKITLYHSDPDIHNFSTSNDGASDFDITSINMEGDKMIIKGTFSAAMPALNKIGEDPDMSNILDVKNGTFDIALPPRSD